MSKNMNIVIPDKIELSYASRKQLESIPGIKIFDDIKNDPKTIIDRIIDAQIVTANYIDLTAEIIQRADKLKYIISPAVGYDWIDKDEARNRGIKILNCPTFNTQAVAEHAIALIFSVYRQIVRAHNSIIKGDFDPMAYTGTEVAGKRLVTIGNGNIGSKVQKMAKGLGMEVDYIDSKTAQVEFDSKISMADIIVVAIPLNDSTRGLVNRQKFSLLKPSSIVINVARGLVVEQDVFYEALVSGRIAGAGIDTFPNDQTISKAGDEITRFAKLTNAVCTPHLAFNTKEATERLGNELIANINSCLNDQPINIVN